MSDLMSGLTRRQFITRVGGVSLGVVALPLLNACTPFAREQEVAFMVWKSPHSPEDEDFFNERLASYVSDNPHVSTNYEVITWDVLTEALTTAYTGPNPPDFVYLPNSFFPRYAEAGQLADLEEVAGEELAAWQSLVPDDVWEFGSFQGVHHGLPFLVGGVTFVWNKDHFREAGLDPESGPQTWEDLREYAQRLTVIDGAGDRTRWGYGIMDNTEDFMLNFVPIPIVNYGGELTNPDDSEWIATSSGHAEGLQIQVDIMQEDGTAPPFGTFVGSDLNRAFLEGRVSMYLTYASFLEPVIADYPDFELGIGRPPAGPANNDTIGGVGYWFMAEQTEDKAEAWELMQFLASAEVVNDYCALTKLSPARTDINPFAGDPVMEAFTEADTGYTRLPLLPFDFWALFVPELEAALHGQKSAQEALETGAQRINDRIRAGD